MKYLLIFLVSQCFAQKQYSFDYIIEYENIIIQDTLRKMGSTYVLTNSKDNTYFGMLNERDSLNFSLDFMDYKSIRTNYSIIKKSDFGDAEFITLNCKDIIKNTHPFQHLTKKYHFTEPKDTIINTKVYLTYTIEDNNNIKRKKDKKNNAITYIVDKETDFHLPIFTNEAVYEEYHAEGKLPNGIIFEKISRNFLNKLVHIQRRVNYLPTNKKIVIPLDCK